MELKDCRKAEIFDLSDALICEAEVTRASMGKYRLLVPLDFTLFDDEPELLKVIFYDNVKGLIHTECRLSDLINVSRDKQSVLCEVQEEQSVEQRRQDLKVPAETGIEVKCARLPSGAKRPPAKITATTKNISAGGVYFCCGYPIPEGATIQFQLHEASRPLMLTAKVLRVEEKTDDKDRTIYGHGCRFIDLKPQAEAELRSYIFKKELQMRQRARNR